MSRDREQGSLAGALLSLRAAVAFYLTPVLLIYWLITGRGGYRGFGGYCNLTPEVTRIIGYLGLGLWLTVAALIVMSRRGKPNWSTCGTIVPAVACVNVVQVLVYLAFRPYHPALLFSLVSIVPAILLTLPLFRRRS